MFDFVIIGRGSSTYTYMVGSVVVILELLCICSTIFQDLPANNDEFHCSSLFSEKLPDVHGENGGGRVEYGCQR